MNFREEASYTQRWVPGFLHFLTLVKISSKELEQPGPIKPYDAQLRFLKFLDEGLTADQHFFVCLKSRQLGISTIMLALDIFWLFMFPGLQGALIADTDDNRQAFRETITQMLESLPFGFKIPVKRHNRGALVLENGSRLQYMAAGKGKNPDLGRSKGFNFVHGTEIATWGDQDGLQSLIDALAEINPHRLYVFESTARGYNVFQSIFTEAKRDPSKCAMFIGWWAKHLNTMPRSHPDFDRWWGVNPALNDQEQAMSALIEQDYGILLTPEQWAWWRRQASLRSEQNLLQEHPWHERVAFQVTGHSFFNLKKINEDMDRLALGLVTYDGYRYEVGDKFLTMRCDKVDTGATADLRIYEGPVKNARYAMGVDVAFGRSETNDRHCIQVFRCFADRLVQVAEWTTSIPETRHVAWVLAHLGGSYRDCMINLEVSGPGLEVMTQMRMLRQDIDHAHLNPGLSPTFDARHALDQARWFLYHRPDTPGQGFLYNFKTNHDNKQEIFNGFRDAYSTDQLIIRSSGLLAEMITLVQNGVTIQASARNKDDRPMATALAIYAWKSWIRLNMMQENRTYDNEMRKQEALKAAGGNVIEGLIPQFFAKAERARKDRDFQHLLGNG